MSLKIFMRLLLSVCTVTLILPPLMPADAQTARISPASGKAMCSALTPADFTNAGVAVLRLTEANLDDERSAYCIYEDKAGKAELDIFYPAGDTPKQAQDAEKAAQAAIGGKFEPVRVAGADEAMINTASSLQGVDASIVVQKRTIMFNISVPGSPQARQQLITLSEIVLTRLAN